MAWQWSLTLEPVETDVLDVDTGRRRIVERQPHTDRPAQRVTRQMRALDPQPIHEPAQEIRQVLQIVARAPLLGVAEAFLTEGEDPMTAREVVEVEAPGPGRDEDSVNQDQRGTALSELDEVSAPPVR